MKKSTSILLMIAGGLVAFGTVLFVSMLAITGGNLGVYLDTEGWHYAQNQRGDGSLISEQHDFTGVTSLDISTDIGSIELREGGAGSGVKVEYSYPSSWKKPVCTNANGTLYFSHSNNNKHTFNFSLFNFPGLSFKRDPKVIITYPAGMEFYTAKLTTDFGNLSINKLKVSGTLSVFVSLGTTKLNDISAGDLVVDNDCGETTLSGITTKTIAVSNDLGNLTYSNVTSERFSSTNSSGNTKIKGGKLGFASISSDLGVIDASDVATTGLEVDSDSGSITIKGELAGKTEVSCDLGSIEITTSIPRDQYNLDLSTDLGKVYINGDSHGTEYEQDGHAPNSIDAENSSGSVRITLG